MTAVARWARRNLFQGPASTALTVAMALFLTLVVPPLWRWAVGLATWVGESRNACDPAGACWALVTSRFDAFLYGSYPGDARWRPNLVMLLLAAFLVPALRASRRQGTALVLLVTLFPAIAAALLWGGLFGLSFVDTSRWGGLMVNVVLAFTAIAGALPLGILLALGRRSTLRAVRWCATAFIELWRGVPLLTVIFMAAVMLPLFLPAGASPDRLIRAMVALTLFAAAYVAEAVRGGLQGVPDGQEEAAYSLGLGYWRVQRLVVLPQALRIALPATVNIAIDLFKDTTLVAIVGITDLLGTVNLALRDQAWLGLAREGYLFSALMFFVCCFTMAMVAGRLERRLARDTMQR